MTQKSKQITCSGCGLKKAASAKNDFNLCSSCNTMAKSLQKDPETIEKILTAIQSSITLNRAAKTPQNVHGDILPEVLDAVRFRTRDRDLNRWYVSISEIEGKPVEIFASTAFDRDHHLQSRISNLTTITRLISLILRHVFLGEVLTLEKVLKQLHRSSRQKNDLPDMLGCVLSKYSNSQHKEPANLGNELE